MNKFTTEIIKNIKAKRTLFGERGVAPYIFSRIPSMVDGADVIMAGQVEGNGFVRVMTPFCYLVGGKICYVSHINGLDEAFFGQSRQESRSVSDKIRREIHERIVCALDELSDEELVPSRAAREECLNQKSLRSAFYPNVLSDKEPVFVFLPDDQYYDYESVVRYLCDSDKFVRDEVQRFLGGKDRAFLNRSFLFYRAGLAFFHNYRKGDNETAAKSIAKVLAELKKNGAKYVRIHIDGDNNKVRDSFRDECDFVKCDLDGVDLVVRVPVNSNVGRDGYFEWYYARCENYAFRSIWCGGEYRDFLSDVPAKDVKKITYHGKVVYSRLSEMPKIKPRKR